MKTIINSKLYDTERAEEIATGIIRGPYYSWEMYENLYKKHTGEFFIERDFDGDGDCIEEYYWVLEHRFEPISEEQAKVWVEKYCDADTYIKLFGEPKE